MMLTYLKRRLPTGMESEDQVTPERLRMLLIAAGGHVFAGGTWKPMHAMERWWIEGRLKQEPVSDGTVWVGGE